MEIKKQIFIAYQGKREDLADVNSTAIKSGIEAFNKYQHTYSAVSWEDDKKTTPINIRVLEGINQSSVFACDLTYFNHNVLFELGYAIGKDKEVVVFINKNIKNEVGNAAEVYEDSFLKIIPYTPFNNGKQICQALSDGNYEKGLVNKYINIENIKEVTNDLFYIESKIDTEFSLDLTDSIETLKTERNYYLISCPTESSSKPLKYFFQNIVKSKCLIIHLLGENMKNYFVENARYSFFAGLAYGLNRKVLMFAPKKYKAPLDFYDILVQYENSNDLVGSAIDWICKEIPVKSKVIDAEKEARELSLIKLGIGCEVAESEKENLLKYFVLTSSYSTALNQEKTIIVGRKGTGKSAIYIKLVDKLSEDKLNYIVNLKPESVDLLEDVEFSKLYNSEASMRSFFNSVWKLVIF